MGRTFFGGRRCGKCAAAQLFARDVALAGRHVYVANATGVAAGTELGHFIGGAFNGGGSREGGHQMLLRNQSNSSKFKPNRKTIEYSYR